MTTSLDSLMCDGIDMSSLKPVKPRPNPLPTTQLTFFARHNPIWWIAPNRRLDRAAPFWAFIPVIVGAAVEFFLLAELLRGIFQSDRYRQHLEPFSDLLFGPHNNIALTIIFVALVTALLNVTAGVSMFVMALSGILFLIYWKASSGGSSELIVGTLALFALICGVMGRVAIEDHFWPRQDGASPPWWAPRR